MSTKTKEKFSVLMSVYKNEKPEYLQQSLESILQQTILPAEIVVVKDGLLTDELDKVLDVFAKRSNLFRFLCFEQNRGLGLALRDGVEACSYEWIARMDTDDICKPERFARQVEYIERHPEIALLGTWIKEFSIDSDHPDSVTELPCEHEAIVAYAKKRNPFRHMTVMFKKSAVLDSGNYRDFLWFEDYDLWVRMLQKGFQVANISEFLVDVRAGEDMFARRGGWRYLKQDLRFQKWLYDSGFIDHLQYYKNVVIRSCVRILPNSLRVFLYSKLLRNGDICA